MIARCQRSMRSTPQLLTCNLPLFKCHLVLSSEEHESRCSSCIQSLGLIWLLTADTTEAIIQFVDKRAADASVRASENRTIRIRNVILSVERYMSSSNDLKPGQIPAQHSNRTGHASSGLEDTALHTAPSYARGDPELYSAIGHLNLDGESYEAAVERQRFYDSQAAAAAASSAAEDPMPEPVMEPYAPLHPQPSPHQSHFSHTSFTSNHLGQVHSSIGDPIPHYGEDNASMYSAAPSNVPRSHLSQGTNGQHSSGIWQAPAAPAGVAGTSVLSLEAFFCPITHEVLCVRTFKICSRLLRMVIVHSGNQVHKPRDCVHAL